MAKRNYNRGRRIEGQRMFGIIQRGEDNDDADFVQPIANRADPIRPRISIKSDVRNHTEIYHRKVILTRLLFRVGIFGTLITILFIQKKFYF
ncbi:hypothetical protein HZS_664 [Henneguya salminicola]|nr:hypothetical protein HZS_664 [Henneguya salminicola]